MQIAMPRFMDPGFQESDTFLAAAPEEQALVRALATDGVAVIDPGIADIDAVHLFVERAQAVRPVFRLTERNAATVAAICRALDGLPLAVELAAARIIILSPDALLAQMSHRFSALGDGPRDAPTRQQTLTAAIGWSYDLLTPEDQRLFRRLTVFSGGFTAEAARAEVTANHRVDAMADQYAELYDEVLRP